MVQRLSERAKTDLALSRGGKEEKVGEPMNQRERKRERIRHTPKGGKEKKP